MYQLMDGGVKRLYDGAFIPINPDNTDYQLYSQWLADGNIPLPAEAPILPSVNKTLQEVLVRLDEIEKRLPPKRENPNA